MTTEQGHHRHVVLVVDDDDDIREGLVELLEEVGYRGLGAANGAEALQVLRDTEELPCMILLDLMMPVMDGIAFREEQRKHPAWSDIPVYLTSASSAAEEAAELMSVQMIRKPVRFETLLTAIQEHCTSPS